MENWGKIPKREAQSLQDRKLRAFIRYQVYPYSPYYHSLFNKLGLDGYSISCVDDLRKIPITRKEDIAPTKADPKKPLHLVLQPTAEKVRKHAPTTKLIGMMSKGKEKAADSLKKEYSPVHLSFTTGRTAQPTLFMYTAYDIKRLREALRRDLHIAGVPRDYKCLNSFPFAPHLAYLASYHGMEENGNLTIHTGGGKAFGTARIIDSVETFGPELLLFIPGYCYHVLRTAAEQGRNFSSVKRVGLAAEKATPEMKHRILDLLVRMGAKDPEIFSLYAFTEARSAWVECSMFGEEGYHLFPDMDIVEIVDPKTGERVGEGEKGEIVYTPLDGRGSVVLRYGTGDIAMKGITWEVCPNCGRTLPRLSSDIRRSSMTKEFRLSNVKGTLVDLNAFSHAMSEIPEVEEWMVEIRKVNDDPYELDELLVHVATKPHSNFVELKPKISSAILKNMEIVPTHILSHSLEDILKKIGMETELKENRLMDRRPAIDFRPQYSEGPRTE
jgi:phenylacetate-coenzyme A ligase PaaK-like adenylate-forming protein